MIVLSAHGSSIAVLPPESAATGVAEVCGPGVGTASTVCTPNASLYSLALIAQLKSLLPRMSRCCWFVLTVAGQFRSSPKAASLLLRCKLGQALAVDV